MCQDHPPVGSLGEGEGGLGLSSRLSAWVAQGCPEHSSLLKQQHLCLGLV